MIIICVAVRMKSTRCPKKAMADLAGEPLLWRLTQRVSKSGYPVVWCTSDNPQDNVIAQFARWKGIEFLQGDELDVMDRFLKVARVKKATTIVRVTGDNPLTDPWLIRAALKTHREQGAEYTRFKSAPRGVKPEIINVNALKRLHDSLPEELRAETEYMTYSLQNLNMVEIDLPIQLNRPDLSFTVDTKQDLEHVKSIYNEYHGYPPTLLQLIEREDKLVVKSNDYQN